MFRFLPSIPVPYKNLLAPWVSIYSLSWYFIRLAFFAIYSSLFICFKCAVSIVSTVPLKPNKIMGRCRERSMKSISLEPNTLFSLALPFYKLGRCISPLSFIRIPEKDMSENYYLPSKLSRGLENTTARERHTGLIKTFFELNDLRKYSKEFKQAINKPFRVRYFDRKRDRVIRNKF